MYCQNCKERPAAVHITKIVNGEKSELKLCQECAAKVQGETFNWEPHFSLNNLLSSLFEEADSTVSFAPRAGKQQERCNTCGLTYNHFRQTGKLGCNDCYQTFKSQLSPVIRRIHGSDDHTGKIPQRSGETLQVKKKIEQLKGTLKELVQQEEFEKAAKARDEIKQLEEKM